MLYDRIIKQGTINEPGSKPKPEFALPSTVNWMRALRILIEDAGIDFTTASAFYADQAKRRMDNLVEDTVLEQCSWRCTIFWHLNSSDQARRPRTLLGLGS
jgi:hypothetical protein